MHFLMDAFPEQLVFDLKHIYGNAMADGRLSGIINKIVSSFIQKIELVDEQNV